MLYVPQQGTAASSSKGQTISNSNRPPFRRRGQSFRIRAHAENLSRLPARNIRVGDYFRAFPCESIRDKMGRLAASGNGLVSRKISNQRSEAASTCCSLHTPARYGV